MGTGNYKIGEKYRSRRRAQDVDRAEKLLERLGAVPTYAQLVERLRKGADVRPSLSAYRSPPGEETEDEADDVVEVDDHVVVVGQGSKELEADLEGLVRDLSVSRDTSTIERGIQSQPASPQTNGTQGLPSSPTQQALAQAPLETPSEAPLETPSVAPLETLPQAPLNALPEPPPNTLPGPPLHTLPQAPLQTLPDLHLQIVPQASQRVQTQPPPSAQPLHTVAPSGSRTALLPEPASQPTFQPPGLLDSLFRCQGTNTFVIPGRNRSYTVEPQRGSCGMVRINKFRLGNSLCIFHFIFSVPCSLRSKSIGVLT